MSATGHVVEQPSSAVNGTKEVALAPANGDSMLAMMERLASNKDVDTDKLRALIDMQKDIMQINAKSAFNAAKALMLAELPTIIEKARGDKDITYAPLEDIVEPIRPVLAKHGFALSHRTEWPDKTTVKVIGVLTHRDGHSEESVFQTAADQTGSKNAIQALGSSVSYGRRYTTNDLLCIVTRRQDDDGQKAGNGQRPDPPEKFEAWWDDMIAVADTGIDALEKAWLASSKDFKAYVDKHIKRDWQALKRKAESRRG